MQAGSPARVERRLVAILAADVAGYSRLTGVDEEGTHVRPPPVLSCAWPQWTVAPGGG